MLEKIMKELWRIKIAEFCNCQIKLYLIWWKIVLTLWDIDGQTDEPFRVVKIQNLYLVMLLTY